MGSLRATGRILEWLVSCLPDDQLRTDSVLRAVGYVNGSLEGLLPRWNIASASQRDTATIAHALAALMTYDRRVFRPYERAEPPADADQVQGQTGRS
jgi:hypothetical protein